MNDILKIYPADFKEKIGFDKISQLLESYCVSTLGKEMIINLKPSTRYDTINENFEVLDELIELLSEKGLRLPEQGFYDLRKEINQLNVEGNWWEPDYFIDLRSLLRTSGELLKLFNSTETEHLDKYYSHIQYPGSLLKKIEKIFTDNGEVSDNASPDLSRIRKTIEQNRHQVRKSLEMIFKNAKKEGWVPEGSSLSVRDGRMVIPITAEAKRRIRGFIHDESSTGQTVFIEPAAVLEGNNKQRELEYEERREVIRILKQISKEVYQEKQSIGDITYLMGFIDFMRAKIKLSEKLKAIKPQLKDHNSIKLTSARHPLLIVTDHKVVPLDILLDTKQRLVLISGPNAGGKSVALKTVALLQYMVQCGLYIPVGEGSQVGVFNKLFIDIGDEQSIENDLSTYSSHLRNMKAMLQGIDNTSLILIDEFGSGTEPHFGGALAESMLEKFVVSGARGIITTHYANLKTFAEKHEGIVNAAMLFDLDKLRPLYQLSIGKPGSSHALDIAYNTGLPRDLIARAKELLGRETIDYDKALSQLQNELKKVQEEQDRLKKKERESAHLIEEYSKLKLTLENKQKQLIDKAKAEAESIVIKANREIEKTIRHIKENKAEKKETKKIRQRLEGFKIKEEPAKVVETDAPLKTGDYVKLQDSNVTGQIIDIQGKRAEVILGDLKTTVDIKKLIKSNRKELREQKSGRKGGMDFSSKLASFSSTLDIRGKRAEEAISIVDKYLDDALLAGASEIKILHGKGNGILKEMVRNQLKGYKQVHNMSDEHIERGGSGITVVNLKA